MAFVDLSGYDVTNIITEALTADPNASFVVRAKRPTDPADFNAYVGEFFSGRHEAAELTVTEDIVFDVVFALADAVNQNIV